MSTLLPCAKCGGEMRLGAFKVSAMRRRGVAHYIDHMRPTTCEAAVHYTCIALKPYATRQEDKEFFKLMQRWNAAQEQCLSQTTGSSES